MAHIFPKSLEWLDITPSEKRVYEALRDGLPERCMVFYSIKWSNKVDDKVVESECDFLVFDPQYGYLTIEVKGGSGIGIEDGRWYLRDSYGGRYLKESPYEQAEKSMRYFKDYYEKQTLFQFGGLYGAVVIFPFFTIDNPEELSNRPEEFTIDIRGLNDVGNKLNEVFRLLQTRKRNSVRFSPDQIKKFGQLVQKRIAISAAAGALILQKEKQLGVINRVQDNIVALLSYQKQFFIIGGAGTGKTWIALKFSDIHASIEENVLILTSNKNLSEFIKTKVQSGTIHVDSLPNKLTEILTEQGKSYNFFDLEKDVTLVDEISFPKYQTVIIDEAQDFTEEWAFISREFLRDPSESRFIVFYDETQNIFERSFGDKFSINSSPFLLKENLRNTSSIYQWAIEKTGLGSEVILNPIKGPEPEYYQVKSEKLLVKRIEEILYEFIVEENVLSSSIVILTDSIDLCEKIISLKNLEFTRTYPVETNKIFAGLIQEYKGLESDIIIYIHGKNKSMMSNYVAYTRARFYLVEIECSFMNC